MDDGVPKAMRRLAGTAMFVWSVRAFDAVDAVEGMVVVADELWLEHALSELVGETLQSKLQMVPGGRTRQASVLAGLQAVPAGVEVAIVHDAARPLVTPALIERALGGLGTADAAVCAVPLADTLKRTEGRVVSQTVPRRDLWRAQTPQAVRAAVLRDAFARAASTGFEATDDAMLVEHAGGTVVVVDGDARNIKITTRDDLVLAEHLLARREA